MKQANVYHQGAELWSVSRYFTILHSLFIIGLLLCSSTAALAVQACRTTSIIASTPTADFIVNGDGTVTHKKTGLMWKVCSEGQVWSAGPTCTNAATTYNWQGALNQAKTVNNTTGGFATFTDWRVPNKTELSSIVERQCVTPSINAAVFPATVSGYWSASPYAGFAAGAWNVNFSGGVGGKVNKAGTFPVRLVRGGQ